MIRPQYDRKAPWKKNKNEKNKLNINKIQLYEKKAQI